MKKVIAIGTQSFEKMREQDNFYIDKTCFIKEWWENQDEVTLITRPRRFGKTLNMDMLNCFFSNNFENRADLFEGLSIWQEEKYQKLQGTYPVIFLSFAGIKENTYEGTLRMIKQTLSDVYNKFYFLLEEDVLNENEKRHFKAVCNEMDETTAALSLHQLSDYLQKYYGKKVIILLDEYDTPLQEAYVSGFWTKLVGFTRNLFNNTFKTNPYLERGIMTGITRVSKESIFSDLNNLEVITTTSDKYATCFGFTQQEVFESLDSFKMSAEKAKVKAWYDGFTFGKRTDIYNPWSIINFLDKGQYGVYWANTSSNGLVAKLIREGNQEIKQAMENLLEGGILCVQLDEQIVFDQLNRMRGSVWSMLIASGYLKIIKKDLDIITGICLYQLAITNRETMIMFQNMIVNWFNEDDAHYNDFIKALLHGNLKEMNAYMNRVALATFSSFDTGNHPSRQAEPERFYHGFVLGLLVELRGMYHLASNRESGLGRYDVVLEPLKPELDAIVLEFKVIEREEGEETLADTVQAALKQINEKKYDTNLLEKGIPAEKIRHYGFAFEGKKVLIGEDTGLLHFS